MVFWSGLEICTNESATQKMLLIYNRSGENAKCELANDLRWKEYVQGAAWGKCWRRYKLIPKRMSFFLFYTFFYVTEHCQRNKCTISVFIWWVSVQCLHLKLNAWNWSKFIKNQLCCQCLCYIIVCVVIALPIFFFVKVHFFVCS